MGTNRTLYLAPMRGLTDTVFRTAQSEVIGGFDRAVAPFFKTVEGGLPSNALRELDPAGNQALEVVPQLLGRSSRDFLAAAARLGELGYKEVNWNLGCPHRMVTKKKMGAGLLELPEEVDRFLDQVFSSIEVSLSVKTRLGMHDVHQLLALMPVLERYPLAELIIHPRTADQMYGGPVHLDAFEACLSQTRHPVVYSGDIFDREDFQIVSKRFPGVNRWMIGRGAVADPFLALRIARETDALSEDELDRLRRLHDALYKGYRERLSGPGHVIARMVGIWEYLAPGRHAHKKHLKRLKKVRQLDEYEAAVANLFESL